MSMLHLKNGRLNHGQTTSQARFSGRSKKGHADLHESRSSEKRDESQPRVPFPLYSFLPQYTFYSPPKLHDYPRSSSSSTPKVCRLCSESFKPMSILLACK